VLSVTSDVTASATYQNAPPKPALPDPSRSFAALVDDKLPADSQSLLPPTPEPAAAPPPRAAQDLPSTDKPPRDTASSNKSQSRATDRSSADDNGPATRSSGDSDAPRQSSDAKSGPSNSDAKSDAKSNGKSGTSQASDSKSSDSTSTDGDKAAAALDSTVTAQASGQPATTPDPIAALIPVAAALSNAPTGSGNTNAPLAIAAAAIAATSASAATGLQAGANAGDQFATKTQDATSNAKTQAQTSAATTPGTQSIVTSDAKLTADVALSSGMGAQGTTTGKTSGAKATTGFQAKTAATATSGNGQQGKDASASVTTTDQINAAPQPIAQADVQVTPPNAVKADADGASTPKEAMHDHSQLAANGQPTPAIADANAQLAAVPQQQISSAAPTITSDKFTVTHAAGAAVPLSGLAVEIAASVQSGKTHFEVRLDPADLGRIDVRIDVDRNGQVTSHLTVEKPETLSMLRQDAPQLQQALNDAGLKTGNGGLQFSLRDHSHSGQNNSNNNQTGPQPQRLVISEDDAIPAAIAGRSYSRMLGASGGVDIRV
jgi:flagellar hook-length control protein FliK